MGSKNKKQRQASLLGLNGRRQAAQAESVRFLTRLSDLDFETDEFPLVGEFMVVLGCWVAYADTLLAQLEKVDAA